MSRGTLYNQPKQKVTLPEDLAQALVRNAEPYPIPQGKKYEYGTAGVCSFPSMKDSADRELVPYESVSLTCTSQPFRP